MPTPQLFRNVHYPTDFSRASEAIASHVAGLANAFHANVRLLNVVAPLADLHGVSENYFTPLSEAAIIGLEQRRQSAELEAKRKLEQLQKLHFDPATSAVCVGTGGVAESIVDFAKEMEAGLILMSTRGLGVMRRFLIGPVTAKVLHDAACPVWTSPHPRELEPFRPYRNIVLAVDYRRWQPGLLTHAAELADIFQAQLSVLTALPERGLAGDDAMQRQSREMGDTLHHHISKLNVRAGVRVIEGNPGEVVRDYAGQVEEPTLIVTGRGQLDESTGYLDSHVYEIIYNAPSPVLTLRGC